MDHRKIPSKITKFPPLFFPSKNTKITPNIQKRSHVFPPQTLQKVPKNASGEVLSSLGIFFAFLGIFLY
jgi:hypothetical protein